MDVSTFCWLLVSKLTKTYICRLTRKAQFAGFAHRASTTCFTGRGVYFDNGNRDERKKDRWRDSSQDFRTTQNFERRKRPSTIKKRIVRKFDTSLG
jgi:hypothetical protein